MKTIMIRDDVYVKLVKLKREGESFSDLLERLLERRRPSLREFVGVLKGSEWLGDQRRR